MFRPSPLLCPSSLPFFFPCLLPPSPSLHFLLTGFPSCSGQCCGRHAHVEQVMTSGDTVMTSGTPHSPGHHYMGAWNYEKLSQHGHQGHQGALLSTICPAPTTVVAVAVCPPSQVVVATLAIPIPRQPRGITWIPALAMPPKAITAPMQVVVPTLRATPIACQKRSPWHLAHLALHHTLRAPRL